MRSQLERRIRPERVKIEHSRRTFILNGALASSALVTAFADTSLAQDQSPAPIDSDLVSRFVRVATETLSEPSLCWKKYQGF